MTTSSPMIYVEPPPADAESKKLICLELSIECQCHYVSRKQTPGERFKGLLGSDKMPVDLKKEINLYSGYGVEDLTNRERFGALLAHIQVISMCVYLLCVYTERFATCVQRFENGRVFMRDLELVAIQLL